MTTSLPTRGQLERTLAQKIQALYREQLGHQPSKIHCRLSEQNLVVVIEGSITAPEQLLTQTGRQELAEQVRSDLDQAMQPQIKALIEQNLHVDVVEILSDATLETGRTGMIVILSEIPSTRNPVSSSKDRQKLSLKDEI